jgi:hypothetical protein
MMPIGADAAAPRWKDLEGEFRVSLGYVRSDIRWLLDHNSRLHYTIALLIGCGCEMVAAAEGDVKGRRGEKIFVELLPPGDWRILADKLYSALRDGLAHGFDTKHIEVDDQAVQIYMSVDYRESIAVARSGLGLQLGVKTLGIALCQRIDQIEERLRHDETARRLFKSAIEYQRTVRLNRNERAAWDRLTRATK